MPGLCFGVLAVFSRCDIPIEKWAQDSRPGLFSAVPSGLIVFSGGYPGLASWATFGRPFGTCQLHGKVSQDFALGYSSPSPSASLSRKPPQSKRFSFLSVDHWSIKTQGRLCGTALRFPFVKAQTKLSS